MSSNEVILCQYCSEWRLVNIREVRHALLSFFVENKLLNLLHDKIKTEKDDGDLLRTTFSLFEFLLKALKKEEELIYFLVKINQENFISEDYVFKEEEDEAYYANFLKLMNRKIN